MQESPSASRQRSAVPTDVILEVNDLRRYFGGNRAVDGATFSVQRGSITGLSGPNGAGKTTCFNCIAGALKPHGGQVVFDGTQITGRPAHRIFRRGLVRTFQIPQELSRMTVLENLLLTAARQSGERPWMPVLFPGKVRKEEERHVDRAYEVLRQVTLDHLTLEYAGNLSGGQRKLLELGRALMADPLMILLDEPSAGVNPTLAGRLVEDIKAIREEKGVTFLVIGHDMDIVSRLCDTIVMMTNGRVMIEGPPDVVLEDPAVQDAYLGSQYR
jgi:branched-chain amino acid transport system ATP-binding protein